MTTNISPTSIVVEVLRDDNYDDWSACMKSYMLAQDLWDLIDPADHDQEVDSTSTDSTSTKAWRKKNAAALHAIQISCSPRILSKIRRIITAKVAWDTLANLQQQHSPSHEVQSQGSGPVTNEMNGPLLHLAAKLSPPSQLARISGATLQMQRELQWYKEVESIIDPKLKDQANENNLTAKELFTNEHKDLLVKGEQWMKEAATSCIVVGALIITVTFTAAFTVPGGNVQETGYPVFKDEKTFTVFIVADAISFFFSSTSVLMFLEIHMTRYAKRDFLKSLPTKLIFGLSMLLLSIATMMVTFCAALIIMLNGRLEIIIPVVLLASIPVTFVMLLQFPVIVEIFRSTYGPVIFNKKMKRWY